MILMTRRQDAFFIDSNESCHLNSNDGRPTFLIPTVKKLKNKVDQLESKLVPTTSCNSPFVRITLIPTNKNKHVNRIKTCNKNMCMRNIHNAKCLNDLKPSVRTRLPWMNFNSNKQEFHKTKLSLTFPQQVCCQ